MNTATLLNNASDYQVAIFDHFQTQLDNYRAKTATRSLLTKAVAGSGKTTTIVAAANLIPQGLRSIFLAFNKDIATELKQRLPSHVEAKTLNSLGWGICKRYADAEVGRQIDFKDFTNGFKIHNLMREMYSKQDIKNFGQDVRWLVGMCHSLGVIPSNVSGLIQPNGLDDSDTCLNNIIENYDYQLGYALRSQVFAMVREVLAKSLSIISQINFDEQKYLPVVMPDMQGFAPKYDIVIIDEVQDVNAVDIALIKLVLKDNGIVVGVGDNRQSIYGFRGADTKATEKFKNAFGADELPLSISYRCGSNIVAHACEVYPEIEAAPNAHEGEVTELNEYTPSIFQGGDMIISRNNAPIVSFAYKLINARIPVFVKGRDIGRNLISIIEKLKASSVSELEFELRLWRERQISMILNDNPDDEDACQRVDDKYQTLMVFIGNNTDDSIDTLKADIEELFSTRTKDKDDARLMKGKVVLSTIHKAKGLEADSVFFLDAFLMFPKWVTPGSWQEEQESNLKYVAITRAKNSLVYIKSKGLL